MDKNTIFIGNTVTLEDGRKVTITKVHSDYSFEWELAKETVKKDEEKESIEVETKEETPKKTAKKAVKATKK